MYEILWYKVLLNLKIRVMLLRGTWQWLEFLLYRISQITLTDIYSQLNSAYWHLLTDKFCLLGSTHRQILLTGIYSQTNSAYWHLLTDKFLSSMFNLNKILVRLMSPL